MRSVSVVAILLIICGASAVPALAQWQKVSNSPSFSNGAGTALLLTDGSVLVHDESASSQSNDWLRLVPDANGSYVNGTWVSAGSMQSGYTPLYFASAVLPDGRVVVTGGEYNNTSSAVETNQGAVYDPVANTWSVLNPPNSGNSPWNQIGDSECTVLPNGQLLLANNFSKALALLDASTLTWTTLAPTGKLDNNSEEGWSLLPDGTLVTVDCGTQGGTAAEKYIIATNTWVSAGNTISSLCNNGGQNIVPEIGPSVLRPDGTVFVAGATGATGVYTPALNQTNSTGSWAAGPGFPVLNNTQVFVADGPAALLPDGNVLVVASPFFSKPSQFFEFDGTNLNQVANTPNAGNVASFQARMLLLPTGQVLATDGSNDVEIYTPSGSPQDAWRPTIATFPAQVAPNTTYVISGTQFNGLSQAVGYGDDAAAATNYPLVRITNHATGHVFYARTFGHSTMAVATGSQVVSTNFTTPAGLESGPSDLEVVANGIPSKPMVVNGPALAYNAQNNLQFGPVCVGTSSSLLLQVFNVGAQDLVINSVQRSAGSADFSVLSNPATPLTIAPGEEVDFTVVFAPTAAGPESATIRIVSNDPNVPNTDIAATGTGDVPTMQVTPPSVDFGPACPGDVVNQTISVNNTGDCPLTIAAGGFALSGDTTDFSVSAATSAVTIAPGSGITVGVAFEPQGFFSTARTATLTITSSAANSPQQVTLSGSAPPPVAAVSPNPLDFGTVCIEDAAGHVKTLQVCNNGSHCPLTVTSVVSSSPDFTVVGPTSFTVAAGACTAVTIKFTPTSDGPKSGTITVSTNDPANPTIQVTVTGTTPPSSIGTASYVAFPPTVIQSAGPCYSQMPLAIQDTGKCNLQITAIGISGTNASEFTLVGLPAGTGATLSPGELLGDGNLAVQFRPTTIARVHQAQVDVTYVSDPASGATTTIHIPLYGEGVTTGARALVRVGGVPVASVDRLQLLRVVGNRNISVDVAMNLPLQTVNGPVPELSFQYHREWGGASNPVQLLTGNYQLTATITVNGKKQMKTVYFSLGTCDFNQKVVVDF